ncbi:MAG: Sec-independent protein translocase protein TatB [Gallionella sp.]|nr:Sec-independent protein translocase protein TatB [Gallionella sp.]
MFDIAFVEMLVVMLVALLVIGPEKLPKVARTAGHFWGSVQRYVSKVKTDISNDVAFTEARKFHGDISEDVATLGNSVKQAELTVAQKVLHAQHREPEVISEPLAEPSTSTKRD